MSDLTKLNRRDEAPRDPASPEPGYFVFRLHPSKVWVPAIIYYEDELWSVEINGKMSERTAEPSVAVYDCWEYGRRVTLDEWMEFKATMPQEHRPFGIPNAAPSHPQGNPKPMNEATTLPESTAVAIIPASMLPTIIAADTGDILGKLRSDLAGYKPDATSEAGRKEIGSKARLVGSAKQSLLRLAKGLKEDAQALIKSVNSEERVVEQNCDAIRDGILAPLEAFKQREKDRVAAHEAGVLELEQLGYIAPDMPSAEIAELIEVLNGLHSGREWQEFTERATTARRNSLLAMERAHAIAVKAEADAAELEKLAALQAERDRQDAIRQQAEREAQIAAQARAEALLVAEAKAANDAAEAVRKAKEAQDAIEAERQAATSRAIQAEQDRKDAEARAVALAAQAKADAEALAAKVEAARLAAVAKAEADKAAAIETERRRVAAIQAAEEAERARREADVAHHRKVHRAALDALMAAAGITEAQGISAVTAIAKGNVPHISISY